MNLSRLFSLTLCVSFLSNISIASNVVQPEQKNRASDTTQACSKKVKAKKTKTKKAKREKKPKKVQSKKEHAPLAVAKVQSKKETPTSDFVWKFSGMFKPEMFFGKNIALLNNCNSADQVWYLKHTLDVNANLKYGQMTYGEAIIEGKGTIRNKSIWGNPASVAATAFAETKTLSSVGRMHNHGFPRQIFWIRELWLKLALNQPLDLSFDNLHTFQVGAFPFQVGRGISLGDAYATGPDFLGFYTDDIIDQFAFGAKLSGDILKNTLTYDLYAGVLNNKSDSLFSTNEQIRGQEIGRINSPFRGFGSINYALAGRLIWTVFDNDHGKTTVEPYAIFNNDPEQKVLFIADATSRLGTVGFATEYVGDKVECGFDTGFNMGHQKVKAWDRNQVVQANKNGFQVEQYDHVRFDSPTGDPALFTKNVKTVVEADRQNEICNQGRERDNNQEIGSVTMDCNPNCGTGVAADCCGTTLERKLFNDGNRFRNNYCNTYQGWMFVADAAYWLYRKELKMAVTAGIASGDDNPNFETIDGNYKGFIGLQEIYSGKRVKSAFVLGGQGKLKRPLGSPLTSQAPSRYATNISRFTNLIFVGTGLTWQPVLKNKKKFSMNPNVLAYWEDKTSKKFSALLKKEIDSPASKFLGTELNLFVNYNFLEPLKGYLVGSVFIPGQHYRDIQGKPLNSDQERALDRLDRTGFDRTQIPNIGHNVAYTLNIGFEFTF